MSDLLVKKRVLPEEGAASVHVYSPYLEPHLREVMRAERERVELEKNKNLL